jgi:hypothetical protein
MVYLHRNCFRIEASVAGEFGGGGGTGAMPMSSDCRRRAYDAAPIGFRPRRRGGSGAGLDSAEEMFGWGYPG